MQLNQDCVVSKALTSQEIAPCLNAISPDRWNLPRADGQSSSATCLQFRATQNAVTTWVGSGESESDLKSMSQHILKTLVDHGVCDPTVLVEGNYQLHHEHGRDILSFAPEYIVTQTIHEIQRAQELCSIAQGLCDACRLPGRWSLSMRGKNDLVLKYAQRDDFDGGSMVRALTSLGVVKDVSALVRQNRALNLYGDMGDDCDYDWVVPVNSLGEVTKALAFIGRSGALAGLFTLVKDQIPAINNYLCSLLDGQVKVGALGQAPFEYNVKPCSIENSDVTLEVCFRGMADGNKVMEEAQRAGLAVEVFEIPYNPTFGPDFAGGLRVKECSAAPFKAFLGRVLETQISRAYAAISN